MKAIFPWDYRFLNPGLQSLFSTDRLFPQSGWFMQPHRASFDVLVLEFQELVNITVLFMQNRCKNQDAQDIMGYVVV